MGKFRIGLIGLGGMAQAHIRWMKEEAERIELTAICDIHREFVEKAGAELGIEAGKRYTDYRKLVADPEVDAVVFATPNDSHAAILHACLDEGKPFLGEKPFTRVFEEAVALKERYDRQSAPVPGMIGFSYRYTPAFRYARELVREGRIGRVRSFSAQYLQGWGSALAQCPFVWRFDRDVTGTGALGDLGSHMIDLARFLFGEFEELSAQMQTIIPERKDPATGAMKKVFVDDFASFQARLAGDVMGVFQTSRNAVGSGNQHEISIYGDIGTIHASTEDPDRLVWIREEESGRLARAVLDVPQRCKVTPYADFVGMLKGEARDGLPGFMDGYRNQEVLDAIVRACETKRAIAL